MMQETIKGIYVGNMYFDPEYRDTLDRSLKRLRKFHKVLADKIDELRAKGESTTELTFLLCDIGDGMRAMQSLRAMADKQMKEEAERDAEMEEIA